MKKLSVLMVLCMVWSIKVTNAQQQVSEIEARNAAINTLRNKTDVLKRSSNTEIDTVYSFANNRSDVLMYEVVFKNGAAVLLSGSKACLPVLGYYIKPEHKNGSVFDINNFSVPPGLQALLNDYAQEIEYCFAQDTIELYHENKWNELQQPSLRKSGAPAIIYVKPLLTTKWGQWLSNDGEVDKNTGAVISGDCPAYNYYVTKTSSIQCSKEDCDNRCPTGCAATAMGAVLNYWKYPVYLPDKIEQYDWCNMPDELLSYSPNYVQDRHKVARLLKDCGDAANTFYCVGYCSSSATMSAIRSALINDFYYSSSAVHRLKSSHPSGNVWVNYIKTDLSNGRPVIYTSMGMSADGHHWVCDGYGSDGGEDYFHFNWGWNGYHDDDWFTLDNLKPGTHNYNVSQEAIFNIYPDLNQDYCNFDLPLSFHYALWDLMGFPVSLIHMTVPQTATRLWSVPEANGIPAAWHTIASGEVAVYTAHEEVRLLPGFHAAAGSVFIARIDPCESCDSKSRSTLLFAQSENTSEIYEFNNSNDTTVLSSNSNLQKETQSNDIQIHPNPNTGTFTIKTGIDPQEIVSIRVLTPLGLVLYEQEGLPSSTIGLPSSAKGVYFVEINTIAQRVVRKMVVY